MAVLLAISEIFSVKVKMATKSRAIQKLGCSFLIAFRFRSAIAKVRGTHAEQYAQTKTNTNPNL